MATRAGVAFVDFAPNFRQLDRKLASHMGGLNRKYGTFRVDTKVNPAATAALNKQSQTLQQVGRAARYAAAGTALLGGAAVVKTIGVAAKFEQQISRLGSVADASGRQMGTLRKQAMTAGAATKFSALEAAQAQTELAKGGLSVKQIMGGGLKSALALAAAGELELADAAGYTVNAIKLFGLSGRDAMKVADGLATAANKTTADVSHFGLALSQGGSAAKAAGLSFEETIASLEALAEIGVKGSDAGTSLKSALLQLASPTKKSAGLMEQLGLNFFDAHGEMKPLAAVAGMLRQKLGGLTREQRLSAATTLVGTDGMRTLLALYDAGPRKITRFEQQLGKSGTAAAVAAKKQDNFKGALENLQGSVETLQISVGSKLLPVLTTSAKRLTTWANDVGRIANRDDLDVGEKLRASLKAFDVEFGADIRALHIGDRLADAVSVATPKIAEAAAKAAPKAVAAFFDAWRGSNVWGKLVVGGFLLHKMGGFAAFRALGRKGGAEMAAGMATGAAGGGGAAAALAGGGFGKKGPQSPMWGPKGPQSPMPSPKGVAAIGGRLGGVMGTAMSTRTGQVLTKTLPGKLAPAGGRVRAVGKGVLGVALLSGVADAMTRQGVSGIGNRFQQALSTGTLGILPAPRTIDERMRTISQRIQTWRSSGQLALNRPGDPSNSLIRSKDLSDFSAGERRMLAGMARLRNTGNRLFGPGTRLIAAAWSSPAKATKDLRLLHNEFGRMRSGAVLSMRELSRVTDSNAKAIARTLGVNSRAGRQALTTNFRLGLRSIQDFGARGQLSSSQAMRAIRRTIEVNSAGGKTALQQNIGAGIRTLKRLMGAGVVATAAGTKEIERLFVQQLQTFGFSRKSALSIRSKDSKGRPTLGPGSRPEEGTRGPGGLQRGGVIVPGQGTGDKVPAMLEPGEVVWNKTLVKAMGGPDKVNAANQAVSRFQQGGVVGLARGGMVRVPGDPDTTGGRDKVNAAIAGEVSSWIKRFKMQIGYAFDPGGGHQSPGHNITGTALDVVPGPGGSWDTVEAGLRAALKSGKRVLYGSNGVGTPYPNHGRGNHAHVEWGGGGAVSGAGVSGAAQVWKDIARVAVSGPDSPLKGVVQGSLDTARAAANIVGRRSAAQASGASGSAGPHGVPAGFRGGSRRALGKQMAERFRSGWGRGPQWTALDDLWGHLEGSWDENLANLAGSGAYGIAQALPASKYPAAGRPDQPPGVKKAAAQIGWGLRYIAGRYTDPLGARAARLAKGWYQQGGIVEMLQRGGVMGGDGGSIGDMVARFAPGGVASAAKAKPRKRKRKKTPRKVTPPRYSSPALTKIIRAFTGAGTHGEDLEVLFSQAESGFRLDEILSQDELNRLLGRIEGKGGIVPTYTSQLDMGRLIAANFGQTVKGSKSKVAGQMAQVKDNLKKLKRWKAELAKIAKRLKLSGGDKKKRSLLVEQIQRIDSKKKQSPADKTRRARLVGELAAVEGRSKENPGLARRASTLRKATGAAQTENRQLYGVGEPDSPTADNARKTSRIGARMAQIGEITEAGASVRDQLRPGGIPSHIFDWQLRASELRRDGATKPEGSSAEVDSSGLVGGLKDMVRQANLRTAVSERQFDVFRNVPLPRYGGSFATGGVVPGPAGAPRTVIAHGGETITPADGGGQIVVKVIVQDGAVDANRIKTIVEGETRRQARTGARVLPGRGGGMG